MLRKRVWRFVFNFEIQKWTKILIKKKLHPKFVNYDAVW